MQPSGYFTFCRFSMLFVLFLAWMAAVSPANADSPVTSTEFHQHYSQIPVVEARKGRMNPLILNFLLGRAPLDQKAACVNALSWKPRAEQNARDFIGALESRSGKSGRNLRISDLSAAEQMVLGYLLALHDYSDFKPLDRKRGGLWAARPMELLDAATKQAPDDFTIAMIHAIVAVQNIPEKKWCDIHRIPMEVLNRFPEDKRNLPPAAVASIMSYLGLYQKYCPLPAGKLDTGFFQAYAMELYRGQLVVGTQAGVAFWDLDKHQLRAVHATGIASSLLVQGVHLWVGTHGALLRHDHTGWKTYLTADMTKISGGYQLSRDPGGKLHAFLNRQRWEYDETGDRFIAMPPLPVSAYHQVFSSTGDLWVIDFMRGIRRQVGGSWVQISLKSPEYPGDDPRHLIADARGGIIRVMDFGTGMYRFDPVQNRFVHEGPFKDKAMDRQVDTSRNRIWHLHYNKGVTLEQGRKSWTFDLSEQKYMRCMIVGPGGDLYVGGQTALTRITRKKGRFVVENYTTGKLP